MDDELGAFTNLHFTFLHVTETLGLPKTTSISSLPFYDIPIQEKFGLKNLTGSDMNDMWSNIIHNPVFAREYMFNKVGVDPKSASITA